MEYNNNEWDKFSLSVVLTFIKNKRPVPSEELEVSNVEMIETYDEKQGSILN